ncbi:hypothetical protein ScPMuIL_007124 [Solemya velum]
MGRIETATFDTTYYPAAALSCAFFLYVFKFVSPKVSAKLCQSYVDLPEDKQIDWNSRVNSSIHATIVCCTCAYTLFYEKEISEEPIWWDCTMVRSTCAIVVGYMSADAIIMAVYYRQIGEIFYFFHHGASIYAYYYVMTYGVLPYFANYRLIAEFSTPLVNQRWFLDILGYKRTSKVFIANGIAMTVTFFAVRIFTMPQYWYKVYSVYDTEGFNRLGHIQIVLVLTCFVLDVINLFWFYKMCKGVHKVVTATLDKNKNIRISKPTQVPTYCLGCFSSNSSSRIFRNRLPYVGLCVLAEGGVVPNDVAASFSFVLGVFIRTRLSKYIWRLKEENTDFDLSAEALAVEIRDFQGELGDYNTLVDKLTTDEDIQDVEFDLNDLKSQNEREAKKIEELFEVKKQKELQLKQLETELDQEKRMAENLVNDMEPAMRERFYKIKDMNEHMLRQLENGQQELDVLNSKVENLQDELSMSQVKMEAVRLYEQLHELESKRDSLLEEAKAQDAPGDTRENLLKQVKEDNQEIASMERQSVEMQEKIEQMSEEMAQLDMDLEENQGEKNQKYKELKKREESMNEFLETYEQSKKDETEKIAQLEENVVNILEHTSRNMARFTNLPSPQELMTMKEDLAFKEGEMKKSEHTTLSLAGDSDKLNQDLQKIEQLEGKINTELKMLRDKISTMETELVTYSDLGKLKKDSEQKRKKLEEDRISLQKRRDTFKKVMQQLTTKYEALKAQLNENETYNQLANLEHKWQHHEQNNFVMKDFISAKITECDYNPISKRIYSAVNDYQTLVQKQMAGKPSM